MKRIEGQILGGALLVVGGVLLLLQNLGFLGGGEILWALLFALGGLAFLAEYAWNRANWWALIPAGVLLALALPIALSAGDGDLAVWGGAGFLAIIGLGFVAVYLSERAERWWAIIPGGVLLTLAVVASLSELELEQEGGAVFFFGLALTFLSVTLLPHGGARRDWALYPAIACLGFGMLVVAATESALSIVGALALILTGGYLLYRTRHTTQA